MASPFSGGTGVIAVKTDGKGSSIDIHISERVGVQAENLSLSTWGASFVLANQLHKFDLPSFSISGPPSGKGQDAPWMLEIGAGTALVGLAAAALWKAKVVLTDLPSIVPGLAANIALNAPLLEQRGGSAACGFLDWTNPSELVLGSVAGADRTMLEPTISKPSVILAADIIYSEDHPELVYKTISAWLATTSAARVIMCYPLRMAYIDHIREFWELMENCGLECVEEGREAGMDEWNEVASTPYEWCIWRWKAVE